MPDITVDQQKLVLNSFATIFQNNLVSADVVTWKEYDGELDDLNALKVSEQVGPRYNVTKTTNGVADLSGGVQGSVFGSEQFTVNTTYGTSMGWGDFQKIKDIGKARESEALRNAATNLAEAIDADVLEGVILASNNWVGTPGLIIDDQDEVVSAYTRLKEEGVSDDQLRAVLNYNDKQGLGSQVVSLPAPDRMATDTFRGGFKGEVGGMPTMFTQQIPTLTVGSRTASASVAVDGGTQNVNYSAVAVSGNPGQYMTQTLNITLPDGDTIVAGEVFTIAGVNAWDNRAGASLGRLQQFTVVTGDVGDGSNDATIRIFPAIIVPGSGTGDDVGINTAHATVDAAPGATAAITLLGTASTAYRPRAVIQKQAFVVNTVPLIMPATGKAMRRALSKVPLSVRMWMHSDFGTGAHSVRFDVALTGNVRDRRRICRLNGVSA